MEIRRAQIKDINKIMDLLSQVLEIHANIRPDIFISNTTKYTEDELKEMIKDDNNPIYVSVFNDEVVGYAFTKIIRQPFSNNMVDHISLFIDDLCVDKDYRHQKIGESLFEYLKTKAKEIGAYEIELNVWNGNDALKFYEKIGMKEKERRMEYIL